MEAGLPETMKESFGHAKNWLLLVLWFVLSITCLFAKTIADYDHAVNFGKYHTYSWYRRERPGAPLAGSGHEGNRQSADSQRLEQG